MQLKDNAKWTITSNSLTGTGSSEYTYTYPYQALYVTIADEESLKLSKEMIKKVQDGEVLEASYDSDSSNVHSVTKSTVYKSTSSSKSTKKTTKKTQTNTNTTTNNTTINSDITKTTEPDVVEPSDADASSSVTDSNDVGTSSTDPVSSNTGGEAENSNASDNAE